MNKVLILTAIDVEFKSVIAHLKDQQEEVPSGTVFTKGLFDSGNIIWEVFAAEIGAGNEGAALETERAIQHFKPHVVMFVGIAGGIKDVNIGDVVVSTKVYGYESGKESKEGFLSRPDVGESSYAILARARAEKNKENWQNRIINAPFLSEERTAKLELLGSSQNAFTAPIAAGAKVLATNKGDIYRFVKKSYGDVLAVEMEGRGVLRAAHAHPEIEVIVIRGISDLLEGKSAADLLGSQILASQHASAFAFEVLANFKPKNAAPKIRLTSHIAYVRQDPKTMYYYVNITNLSDYPISVTHIWYEGDDRVYIPVSPAARRLPIELRQNEPWSTWLPVDVIPENQRREAFNKFKVRLSTDDVFVAKRDEKIPPVGSIPGGPIQDA